MFWREMGEVLCENMNLPCMFMLSVLIVNEGQIMVLKRRRQEPVNEVTCFKGPKK